MMALPIMAVLSLPLLLLLVALLWRPSKRHLHLPPGPRPWPLVGNLVHLCLLQRQLRRPPHALLAAVARAHGPLVHLRLGARPLVVASSPAAAAQVLKARDRELSGRYVPACFRLPIYTGYSLPWAARCDDHWRSLRALCKAEIFSACCLEAFRGVREGKAREMVELLLGRQGEDVRVGEVAFRTIFNMLGNMLFSRDVIAAEGEKECGDRWDMMGAMSRSLRLGMTPNVEDFYPWVFSGLDLQGLRRQVKRELDKMYEVWDGVIRERRREIEAGTGGEPREVKEDFLQLLLGSACGDLQLKALFLDIFTAGTDTSTTLVEWTMSELVKNPQVMKLVREELDRVVGSPGKGSNPTATMLCESHLAHLPYLHACIKETLRLHPPVPLLLPHRAVADCEVMGYMVPEGCTVAVNVWAIGRDPEVWEDPLRFAPERFLDCSVDFKGMDFGLLPFGAGRRICPGLSLASRMAPLVVASMVHNFGWFLPEGMGLDQLGMGERLGLVLEREQPLVLVPKSSAKELLRSN